MKELEGLKIQLRISKLLDHAALVGAGVAWFASTQPVSNPK
jgi:hypothetical protein